MENHEFFEKSQNWGLTTREKSGKVRILENIENKRKQQMVKKTVNVPNEQRNLIAENVARYLEPRLKDTQKALKQSGAKTISLDEYMKVKEQYEISLKVYDKQNEAYELSLYTDKEVEKPDPARREQIANELKLHKKNVINVALSDKDIAELLSLTTFGIIANNGAGQRITNDDREMSTNEFLVSVLDDEFDGKRDGEKKFIEFMRNGGSPLNPKMELYFGFNGIDFKIYNHGRKGVVGYNWDDRKQCMCTVNGTEATHHSTKPAWECELTKDYYFADTLVPVENDHNNYISIEKRKLGSKTPSLVEVLREKKLDCLIAPVLTLGDLRNLRGALEAFNKHKHLYTEEAEVMADFWANGVRRKLFDNSDKENAVGFAMVAAMCGGNKTTNDQAVAFKNEITKRIQARLLIDGACHLKTEMVDPVAYEILVGSARVALIDPISIPMYTSSRAEYGKVEVWNGYGTGWQSIYEKVPQNQESSNETKTENRQDK